MTVDTATLPPDMDPTYDLDSGTVNPDNTTSVVLATDEMRDDVDFGYFSTAEGVIGDYIWYDVNRDGIQDPTEIGIPNALVRLEGDINNNGNLN